MGKYLLIDKIKKVRSRAPLRLGLGGGGTDINSYASVFGGYVLNATINMYAHCSITSTKENVEFHALDLKVSYKSKPKKQNLSGKLILHKAVYNKIMIKFNNGIFDPIKISTSCDAPPGSGLGSSSTIVVAIIQAFKERYSLPLGEYDIASLAYEIEREDCSLSGGKQDQYCAAFGGFNFMEFHKRDRVIVNPLRIKRNILAELESSMLLFFSGVSRDSSRIIDHQIKSLEDSKKLEALHNVKESALKMKEAMLTGDLNSFFSIQHEAWNAKKKTSSLISNNKIDKISEAILKNGSYSMKVSGAGGGGFIIIYCDPEKKLHIKSLLKDFNGQCFNFNFTEEGASSWRTN